MNIKICLYPPHPVIYVQEGSDKSKVSNVWLEDDIFWKRLVLLADNERVQHAVDLTANLPESDIAYCIF